MRPQQGEAPLNSLGRGGPGDATTSPGPSAVCNTNILSRPRTLPFGFVPPCLPTKAPQPPSGDAWLHEIKHDGFRVVARKDGDRVRLYSRPGNDLTYRFTLIVDSLVRLRSHSCIDGEVACNDHATPSFDRIRYPSYDPAVSYDRASGFARPSWAGPRQFRL